MRTDDKHRDITTSRRCCAPKQGGRLDQKVSDPEPGFEDARPQTLRSPVESQDLNRPQGKCVERGKPVVLPAGKASRKASRKGGGFGIAEEAKAGL